MKRTNLRNAAANDNALRPYKPVLWHLLDQPEAPAAPALRPWKAVDWACLDRPEGT